MHFSVVSGPPYLWPQGAIRRVRSTSSGKQISVAVMPVKQGEGVHRGRGFVMGAVGCGVGVVWCGCGCGVCAYSTCLVHSLMQGEVAATCNAGDMEYQRT